MQRPVGALDQSAEIKAPKRRLHPPHVEQGAAAIPKLDQFPSPQPLSEQERILAGYVENFPERAALVAKMQSEDLRRERLEEMKAFPSSNIGADSEEQ